MSGRSRLDRTVDRLAGWGRVVAVLGVAFLVASSAWSALRYRQEYGTWRPWASFPARFLACDGRTYLPAGRGPSDDEITARSTVLIRRLPHATVLAARECVPPACTPAACGIPAVMVVRDGDEVRVYALSGGP